MENEYKEACLLALSSKLLLGQLYIFLELANRIFQSGPGIVNLVDDENVLANQVGHLQRAKIQPLSPGNLSSRDFFGVTATEVLVER